MKKLLFVVVVLVSQLAAIAQERPKFDPRRFEAELEQFVSTEAGLSPQEAADFFPVYREMRCKQRTLFMKLDEYRHIDYRDNKLCEKAIRDQDEIDAQIKELQRMYHLKFMKILPAGKVLKILRAEDRFHRKAFRKAATEVGRKQQHSDKHTTQRQR